MDQILDTIMVYTIENGLLTSMATVASFICVRISLSQSRSPFRPATSTSSTLTYLTVADDAPQPHLPRAALFDIQTSVARSPALSSSALIDIYHAPVVYATSTLAT